MRSVTYISTATSMFSQLELVTLLDTCRANNFRHGLTGMLLYAHGTFIQTLEGEEKSLLERYNKITADSRHKGIIKLIDNKIDKREFSNWTMGFARVSNSDLEKLPGYSSIMNEHPEKMAEFFSKEPSRAQRLLMNFRAKS